MNMPMTHAATFRTIGFSTSQKAICTGCQDLKKRGGTALNIDPDRLLVIKLGSAASPGHQKPQERSECFPSWWICTWRATLFNTTTTARSPIGHSEVVRCSNMQAPDGSAPIWKAPFMASKIWPKGEGLPQDPSTSTAVDINVMFTIAPFKPQAPHETPQLQVWTSSLPNHKISSRENMRWDVRLAAAVARKYYAVIQMCLLLRTKRKHVTCKLAS